jgi:uncharacterized protein YdeI (YjbR/CyaY-like superfamily)
MFRVQTGRHEAIATITKSHMETSTDSFFQKDGPWQEAFIKLRGILSECALAEELKWGKPCYTYNGANIVLMHGFKEYCALLFHKGVLLKDTEGLLVQQTENVQASRQLRFTSVAEINEQQAMIKAYVYEAIEIEKAGLTVEMKKTSEYDVPAEFEQAMEDNEALKKAFGELTPGRQRGYLLHFSQAKQSGTRQARIEKCTPAIMEGKGLTDR